MKKKQQSMIPKLFQASTLHSPATRNQEIHASVSKCSASAKHVLWRSFFRLNLLIGLHVPVNTECWIIKCNSPFMGQYIRVITLACKHTSDETTIKPCAKQRGINNLCLFARKLYRRITIESRWLITDVYYDIQYGPCNHPYQLWVVYSLIKQAAQYAETGSKFIIRNKFITNSDIFILFAISRFEKVTAGITERFEDDDLHIRDCCSLS